MRVGIHVGDVTEVGTDAGGKPKLVGLGPDIASRVSEAAGGSQILLTRRAFDEARGHLAEHPRSASAFRPICWSTVLGNRISI